MVGDDADTMGMAVRVDRCLAPEYFTHGIVDEKTDVFAFGVFLLELISGRKPVDGSHKSLIAWVSSSTSLTPPPTAGHRPQRAAGLILGWKTRAGQALPERRRRARTRGPAARRRLRRRAAEAAHVRRVALRQGRRGVAPDHDTGAYGNRQLSLHMLCPECKPTLHIVHFRIHHFYLAKKKKNSEA